MSATLALSIWASNFLISGDENVEKDNVEIFVLICFLHFSVRSNCLPKSE